MLAIARNVAPAGGPKQGRPKFESKSSLNKAPAITMDSKRSNTFGRNGTRASTTPEHVFYRNYQARFSWEDDKLKAALGIVAEASGEMEPVSSRGLSKRAPAGARPGSNPSAPLLQAPSCLGCIKKLMGEVNTIKDLDTRYLEQQIEIPDNQLNNRCVFYTSVPTQIQDRDQWNARVALGVETTHPGLSKIATQWACKKGLVTIWVSKFL